MGHQLKEAQQIHGPLSKKSVDLGGVDGGPQWGITAHSIDDDLTASRAENRLRPNRGIISNSSRGSSRVYRRGHICCGAVLLVPPGYVSETPLSDTATYYNATFSSLGVTPGTYTWTWSTDTFTLDVSNSPVFVGMPGQANCQGQSLSSFTQQFGGLGNAASQLGFSSVSALRTFISGYCAGSSLVALTQIATDPGTDPMLASIAGDPPDPGTDPIPEPASIALLGAGLACFAAVRRRR
jgi:hypothetical protein